VNGYTEATCTVDGCPCQDAKWLEVTEEETWSIPIWTLVAAGFVGGLTVLAFFWIVGSVLA
jgi:hypothetical protein